jgi:sugar lactone lactonase YvrE
MLEEWTYPRHFQRFRLLQLPQTGWILGASWYVVFLLSLWDADTLIFVIPPGAETLALRIFNLLHYGHNSQVNGLTLLMLISAITPYIAWQSWKLINQLYRSKQHQTLLPTLTAFGVLCLTTSGCNSPDAEDSNSSAALESKFFEEAIVIGTQGRSPGYFIKPRSLTVDANDFLYVVDMTGRVQKFDPDGEYILQWQMPELERGRPKGMCVDADGNIVVVEPHYARVNHFTPDGQLVRQWGTKGSNEGSLTFPRAVTTLANGNLIVSEYQTVERVQRFSPDGATFLGATGEPGNLDAQFNRPEGLVTNPLDQIFVADSCNHRIQILDAEGNWLKTFGTPGNGPGEMSYPYDLAIDQKDHLFVCEFGNSRIQIFDSQHKTIEILGGPGDAPGQFNNPWSIAMDSKGDLYVADSANHRVQKLIRRKSIAFNKQPEE